MEEDTVYSRLMPSDILGTKIWKGNSSSLSLKKANIYQFPFG